MSSTRRTDTPARYISISASSTELSRRRLRSMISVSNACRRSFGTLSRTSPALVFRIMPGAQVALAAEPNAAVNVVARNALAAPGAQLAARTLVTALCFVACAAPATVGLATRGGHQPLSTRALYRSSNRRRDTIGTLAPLAIDIISLFPARYCYGGAPRGERPASWDARRLARRLACRVTCRPSGCFAEHPNVSRRSAHPSIRGE